MGVQGRAPLLAWLCAQPVVGKLHSGDFYLGHLGNNLKGTPSKCVVWTVSELAL